MDKLNAFFSPTSSPKNSASSETTPQPPHYIPDNNNNQNSNNSANAAATSSPSSPTQLMNRFHTEAKSAIDRLQNSDTYQQIGDKMSSLAPEIENFKRMLTEQADRFAQDKMKMLRDFEQEKKQMIIGALSKKLSSAVSVLLNILVVKIKDAIDDPYMPRFIKKLIDLLIDAVYPDVAEDIKEGIFAAIHPLKPVDHGTPPMCYRPEGGRSDSCSDQCCCAPFPKHVPVKRSDPSEHNCCVICCCGMCYPNCYFDNPCHWFGFLAWFRYTMVPYDKSFWRQIRDPSWWWLTLVACIPEYGISQIYYLIWFLLCDKSDEYQLLCFIKSFKCLQFVSLGLISAAVGGGQLFICLLPSPYLCPDYAPREELFALFLFCSQIFIVWIAFLCLNCAHNKGGLFHQLSQAKAARLKEEAKDAKSTLLSAMAAETVEESFFETRVDDKDSRARLWSLLIYDTICFAVCAGLILWAAFFNVLDPSANVQNFPATDPFWDAKNWKFVLTLYFIKTLYGLLAFPFVLLQIPGVSALFSHAKPTGYNPWGATVPYVGAEVDDVPWRIVTKKNSKNQDGGKLEDEIALMSERVANNFREGTEKAKTMMSEVTTTATTNNNNNNNNNNSWSQPQSHNATTVVVPVQRMGDIHQPAHHHQVASSTSPSATTKINQPQWGTTPDDDHDVL